MKKVVYWLLSANLVLVLIYFLNSFEIVHSFIDVFVWVILMPIVFGVFIYYILRPLNNFLIKRGVKKRFSTLISILVSLIVLFIVGRFFAIYFINQITEVREVMYSIMEREDMMYFTNKYFSLSGVDNIISGYSSEIVNYLKYLFLNIGNIFDKGMMIFSDLLLIFLITYFLLKDGYRLVNKILMYTPNKYKDMVKEILEEGDRVLSTYIIGQATVALSLSTMIFVGYKIIHMPSALLLASTTFVLAFIPFVGFLISMIIPYIIAITMGVNMVVKLSILFIVAQTLKGRVVVPFIMGKVMKIHPLTDIFLVVMAATILGPLGAFCIVPIYSLLKASIIILRRNGYFSIVDKIYKV